MCLGHRRYAVMSVYTPRAAVRVFRLFPSVALQLAASVRGNRPSSLLFADGRRSRWTEVGFIPGSSPLLVCVRRFYFSCSSRPSAVTLHLRSRARGSSQVKVPPCETTTLCLCWFERTRPVGTSCSASDAPCCFWARSRETTSNVPAVSFFFALSCVWRLLHFSSWRQRRGRGNLLKCDKLKGKPPGMNERWGGKFPELRPVHTCG